MKITTKVEVTTTVTDTIGRRMTAETLANRQGKADSVVLGLEMPVSGRGMTSFYADTATAMCVVMKPAEARQMAMALLALADRCE